MTAASLVPEPHGSRGFEEALAALPAVWQDDTLSRQIREASDAAGRKVVVLDDDPTGPQAVSDTYVLTEWSAEALMRELREPRRLFFVLTNTRSMSTESAVRLHQEIAQNLSTASAECSVPYTLISRGDSTMRGHFPDEVEALGSAYQTIVAPAFFEGGRYTIGDVQWVREGELLLPAAETPYARDLMFGYRSSNLRNWVQEKSLGRMPASGVDSFSIEALRNGGPEAVERRLLSSRRHTTILNAATYRDLEVFCLGQLRAERRAGQYLVRSAASYVRVRAGQADAPMALFRRSNTEGKGGLVLVGSHVPKSSTQLARLKGGSSVSAIELRVNEVSKGRGASEVSRISVLVNQGISADEIVVVYTTRAVGNASGAKSLMVGTAITNCLVDIVRRLEIAPGFIVTKGGWSASEIGTKALRVKRAYAQAPILPGVPIWVLGAETRFPGVPYVIFPGNVGTDDALLEVVRRLE